jgi:Na+/proline symporter/nitrogen-specific signal transduction histidine kinase
MNNWIVILISVLYMLLLFAIASWSEKKSAKGKSLVNNPYVYTLSLAVYCTAWTYYGSVGNASMTGLNYLTIYIGPTLMAPLWWFVLRKIIRISKVQKITTLADFISSRYGKSVTIGGFVTIFAVLGIIPYISLQLKAISTSFNVLISHEPLITASEATYQPFYQDSAFYITLILIAFTILYGTRNVDATRRNEGLVTAIAFESVFKLMAFLVIGAVVTYGVFNGFGDIFSAAYERPELRKMFTLDSTQSTDWLFMLLLSMMAIMFLPRQFHMAVKENVSEKHLNKAIWLFPLYLLIINVFVLPIALGGSILFEGSEVNADNYVLAIPIHMKQEGLAVLTYLGGFSAATSMVIVSAVALSVMLSNNLVVPLMVRNNQMKGVLNFQLGSYSVNIRRIAIAIILILALIYYHTIGKSHTLISMGLISFAAVAQFAPAILGGIYWKKATKNGALAGMIVGFALWIFTLVVPVWVSGGLLPQSMMDQGLWKLGLLRPYALFGLEGMSPITHGFFWSLFFNLMTFVIVSYRTVQSAKEANQAEIFVDIFKYSSAVESSVLWKGTAYISDIHRLLENILGPDQALRVLNNYGSQYKVDWEKVPIAEPQLVNIAENELAGALGAASARLLVSSVVKEEPVSTEEVLTILKEKQQLLLINKELQEKSRELKKATDELTAANEKLRELDLQKDEFISTVAHEMKTPLTSIRAFSEILTENDDLSLEERKKFLETITDETLRMSRLIMQVLDLERFQSGKQKLTMETCNLNKIIDESVETLRPIIEEKKISLTVDQQKSMPESLMDRDRIKQVVMNLVSNATKFCNPDHGEIIISSYFIDGYLKVNVSDNGEGVSAEYRQTIFEPFFQADDQTTKKPVGSGLGLAISKTIIQSHSGSIWVEREAGKGARFSFEIPYRKTKR